MKDYNKKIRFTFALSLICFSNVSLATNDNNSKSNSTSESLDSRPGFLEDSHANDPLKSFDSHNHSDSSNSANDNMGSPPPVNNTPTPTPAPIAPRRLQK